MLIKIPDCFKYKLRNSQKEYHREPPGTPDVAALIANKPYWVSPVPMCIDKQKALVLADWTASCWSTNKRNQVMKLIGELRNQGFTIYIWCQGKVRLLDRADLSTQKLKRQLDGITFASPQDIAKAAVSQNKLTLDEIQIIDDYWLGHILSGKEKPGPHVIRTSELRHLQVTTLNKILNSATPKLEKIIHDVFSEQSNKNAELLIEQLGDITVECNYTKATLGNTGEDVFADVSMGKFTLKNEQLKSLKIIDFDPNGSIQYLQALFKATPNLEKINLKNSNKWTETFMLEGNSLKELKVINLSRSNISGSNLQTLLKAASNLETLYLIDCNKLAKMFEFGINSLKKIKFIDLSRSNISGPNLQALLKDAPDLEKINLSDCKVELFELRVNSLNKLKVINLEGSNISRQNLQALLKAAPNLEAINLNYCKDVAEALVLEANSLKELKKITLRKNNISSQDLQALLKTAPNLEKIYLGECPNLTGEFVLEANSMKNLKTINLSESTISRQNVQTLLKAAPNLETINLENWNDFSEALILKVNSLKELKVINLSYSNISGQNLQTLLKAAPNLETIDLRDCKIDGKDWAEVFELEVNHLNKIKAMDLSESKIPRQKLQAFLKATPNLEVLNLSRYKDLAEALALEANSLKKLKVINLSYSNISVQNLQVLLKAAPNLEAISLLLCNNLAGMLDLETNSLKELRAVSLSGTNISMNSWETILQAAPNIRLNLDPLIQTSAPLINPAHDPKEMKEFNPTPENKVFEFKNTNKTKNQGMIIAKLCQYFTLSQKHLDLIPKIQDGICVALSHYFLSLNPNEWDKCVEKVLGWNGELHSLDKELIGHFTRLYDHIQKYQLHIQHKQYIGDALESFLDTNNNPCILKNPWHAIALKPDGNDHWYVYDPNYVTGYQKVTRKRLLETIHTAIGTLVSIESDQALYQCAVTDPDAFIGQGGLLALCQSKNAVDLLSQVPKDHGYSRQSLDGLLLRDISGKPAWVLGLNSHDRSIVQFTQRLIDLFQQGNKKEAQRQLAQSLDALTPQQKGECITTIVQASSSQKAFEAPQDDLIAVIRTSERQGLYEKALRTWDKNSGRAPTPLKYCQQCLSSAHKKRLIELGSTQQVDNLRVQLEHHAMSINRPVFYIDNPDDLVCSAPWLNRNDNNLGELHQGPGGALYEFIQEHKEKHPLLLVNYERFNADDLVRFNGLLDKEPHADGTPLPAKTTIIGLVNRNKPECYQGSDFYSRFSRTEQCPLTDQQLDALQPSRTVEVSTQPNEGTTLINLYHASDWNDRLLGRWGLNGDLFEFSEGELVNAIKLGKPIEIQNGLWGDKEFERFWHHALTNGVRHAGRIIKIPKHIKSVRPKTDGYEWRNIPQIEAGVWAHETAEVLNPTCLVHFFETYELVGNKLLKKHGLIERAKKENKPLRVYVTRSLNDDAWAMLMDECTRLGVALIVQGAQGVEFPAEFAHHPTEPIAHKGLPENLTDDLFITSTDIDTTVSMLTKKQDESIVIDVSECTAADLWVKLDGTLNKDTLKFEFSQANGALKTALMDNKNIILKGHFSPELLDSLAPILQTRQQTHAGGQIVLVTDDEHAGAFVSNRYAHRVSKEEKLACLPSNQLITEKLVAYLDAEPLSILQARYYFLESNPQETNSDGAWLGMNSLSGSTHASTALLDKARSAEESAAFTQERIAKVNAVLHSAPYVFLTGLSGVGKSTFVEKELCKNDALYLTEERIQNWAEDKSNRRKILFIDEANLSSRQWSEFEGLFNTPPSVLVHGTLHILTPAHRVVFAGNPVNYGDERTLAPLFQRHGNAVLFTPLPPAVIYEEILKPIVTHTEEALDLIADRILQIYRFICDCSTTEVLITPRELQMMALLTLTYFKNHPGEDIKSIAEHFSYELAKNLIPKTNRAAFDAQFTPNHLIIGEQPKQNGEFLVTPSRAALTQLLNDLLDLRQWRRDTASDLNPSQKNGGLGGLIIEGEPGIGKSELVIAELRARNYTEEKDFKHPTTKENPFYRMPVSMAQDEKEALLIKAFNEGAVVIIDEINSCPMMERLLNDLLMGKNPKGELGESVKSGFMVIGTQNPVTMAGRRLASTALQRRLLTTELPEYTSDEMNTILRAKGIPAIEADAMIVAYEKNRLFAINSKLSPVPNFRNLITVAEEYLKALPKEPNEQKAPINQRAFTQLLQKIDTTLQELSSKIGAVNQHQFHDAKKIAVNLLSALTQARTRFEEEINKPGEVNLPGVCRTFDNTCKRAINDAKPVLKRDLAWGDYLINLLKTLMNAVAWGISLGNANSFFAYSKPTSLKAVEKTEQDLDLQETNNPKFGS